MLVAILKKNNVYGFPNPDPCVINEKFKIWLKYSSWFRSYHVMFMGVKNDIRVTVLKYDLHPMRVNVIISRILFMEPDEWLFIM